MHANDLQHRIISSGPIEPDHPDHPAGPDEPAQPDDPLVQGSGTQCNDTCPGSSGKLTKLHRRQFV